MLVLTRKLGEAIIIDRKITVTVVQIDRGKVRLSIEAPRDIPILRAELAERTKQAIGYTYELEEAAAVT